MYDNINIGLYFLYGPCDTMRPSVLLHQHLSRCRNSTHEIVHWIT